MLTIPAQHPTLARQRAEAQFAALQAHVPAEAFGRQEDAFAPSAFAPSVAADPARRSHGPRTLSLRRGG